MHFHSYKAIYKNRGAPSTVMIKNIMEVKILK